MKRFIILSIAVACTVLLSNCNKEKRLMDALLGNWNIETSTRALLRADGTDSVYEEISNAGSLVIYEDANNPSKEMRLYDFTYIGANNDTITAKDTLVTDEKNKRMILSNALTDSTGMKWDLVWTIEKTKKNKQTWSIYGVDSTFFYPPNNQNPGDASNWLVWRIEMKRE